MNMKKFKVPDNIEPEAKAYIKDVLAMLQSNGIIEDVDDAAIKMLAYNYSTFIKASKIVEEEGLTITSDRGNIAEHPAVKIGRDAQTSGAEKRRIKDNIQSNNDETPTIIYFTSFCTLLCSL